MKLTERRCKNSINDSLITINNICDSMVDLQNRLAIVDILTVRHFVEAETEKISYYDDILANIYDIHNYLETTNFNSLMALYGTLYLKTKERMAKLKAEGCN